MQKQPAPSTAEQTIAMVNGLALDLANIAVWIEQAEQKITLLEIAMAGTHATVAALRVDVDRARDPHRRQAGEPGLAP